MSIFVVQNIKFFGFGFNFILGTFLSGSPCYIRLSNPPVLHAHSHLLWFFSNDSWHPKCTEETGGMNCSEIIMANGQKHVNSSHRCELCGKNDKVKINCHQCKKKTWFHITCARQAGLELRYVEDHDKTHFLMNCFHHVSCENVLRARMEDMIERERLRSGNNFENSTKPMTNGHAAQLLHWGVKILSVLGWAWRWADWWVPQGDNWEPFLEAGQNEQKMTKEELKMVDSTPESRRRDAKACRLAAFGAALRNRDYDRHDRDNRVALHRALSAILHTQSLVGPLEKYEIDFFAEWLARAYRSKSPLLGFGNDKIPVDHDHCKYRDGSPKYELGMRALPGSPVVSSNSISETNNSDIDDFFVGAKNQNRERPIQKIPRKPRKKKKKHTIGGVEL